MSHTLVAYRSSFMKIAKPNPTRTNIPHLLSVNMQLFDQGAVFKAANLESRNKSDEQAGTELGQAQVQLS